MSADLPKEIQSLFFGFQPYRGGDDLLWSLNELCNRKKHNYVLPMQQVMWRGVSSARGFGIPFDMPNPPKWDTAKNEMVVIRFGPAQVPNATGEYDFDFYPYVAINEVPVVEGKELLAVLAKLCLKVESILNAIEAECKRLKMIP